ncbi:MAG: TIGR00730 family Rossman fold protein [Bacteroidota bacterium]|nr:TIGR00730 family Rossman fold protein [Bacteroidota bacterium]
MTISSLAVFCGSQSGDDPLFLEHAKQLGFLLAEKNIALIYGGGNKGMMSAVANAVLGKNGKVIGIIPKLLTGREHQHHGITELIEVPDMHTRKKMLYEKCDAALIMPGGFGTMDEFFEMLTWNQLKIHDKKIFILNTSGFYDHLIRFLYQMEEHNFLYHKIADRLTIVTSPDELIFE